MAPSKPLWSNENAKKLLAVGFIGILAIFIIKGLWQYLSAFFGTGVLYVLFKKVNCGLRNKTFLKKKGAALITILIALLVVIVPTYFLLSTAVSQLVGAVSNPQHIIDAIDEIDVAIPQVDLTKQLTQQIPRVGEFVANTIFSGISDVTRITITLFITFFLLYFLFIEDEKKLEKETIKLIPFNTKNSKKLMKEFKNITNATLITSGLMALLQGFLLAIIFLIFGVQAAIFWGLLGAFLSFVPLLGPALIWVPVVIIRLAETNFTAAIFITLGGILIANIDNLLRPFLNRKVGKINQVVSILGIFLGLTVFGLIGVFVGPIILSFFLLTIKMFNDEYLR